MKFPFIALITSAALLSVFSTGCSTASKADSKAPQQVASQVPPSEATKSEDGQIGNPIAGSKFSKLEIGMPMNRVQEILGRSPDRTHSHETGKRWIPFYFGPDARRLQAMYKGEGCLTFTGGNVWGGGGGNLVRIMHDASGACYKP